MAAAEPPSSVAAALTLLRSAVQQQQTATAAELGLLPPTLCKHDISPRRASLGRATTGSIGSTSATPRLYRRALTCQAHANCARAEPSKAALLSK